MGADQLRAGVADAGGGGQAKIAMLCQGRGLRGRRRLTAAKNAVCQRRLLRRAAWSQPHYIDPDRNSGMSFTFLERS